MTETSWQVPDYDVLELAPRATKYCLCIPVINEGERIRTELAQIKAQGIDRKVDVLILDAGSTDASLDTEFLKATGVRVLLTKTGPGKLGAQLRMGYAYALEQGYEGIITIDGNAKDDVSSIPSFMAKLDEGYDLVQGSRFVEGGRAVNTPVVRHLAVKLIHIPIISALAGFQYTDTTNGYRAYSKRIFSDPRIQPFRDIFSTYELLGYMSVKVPKLGYKVCELPVTRSYPKSEKTPTKISHVSGNLQILNILLGLCLKRYDPQPDGRTWG